MNPSSTAGRTAVAAGLLVPLAVLVVAITASAGSSTKEATILATASARGAVLPSPAHKIPRGGFARRATVVDAERAKGIPTLLVDAGNFGATSTHQLDPWKRTTFIWDRMARLGYDAVTPGDLELLEGIEKLEQLHARRPGIRVVSANLQDKRRGRFVFPRYALIRKGDVTFGVTGVTGDAYYAFNITRGKQKRDDFAFMDSEEALQEVVPELRARSDFVVALIHEGPSDVRRILKNVEGIDVAIVGHNPGMLARPERAESTLVVRAGNRGQCIAVLHLTKNTTADSLRHEGGVIWLDESIEGKTEIGTLAENFENAARVRREEVQEAMRPLWMGLRDIDLEYPYTLTRLKRHGEAGSWSGAIADEKGGELAFWWKGGSTRTERPPLRVRLVSPEPPRPLYLWGTRNFRKVKKELPIGGSREGAVLNLLRFCTERLPEESDARGGLPELIEFLETQAERAEGEPPPYWERRAVVYVLLGCRSDGTVDSTRVLENNDYPESADSLLAAVREWKVPPPRWKDGKPRRFTTLAAFTLDRRETLLQAASGCMQNEALPPDVRELLDAGALSSWTHILRTLDPEFDLADFLDIDEKRPVGDCCSLDSTALEMRGNLGLHQSSPDGRWILDPFAGVKVREGRVNARRASVAIVDARTNELASGWKERDAYVQQGAWADTNNYVLVGWSAVAHPRLEDGAWIYIRVPTVWVGDAVTGAVRRFQGDPVAPLIKPQIETALLEHQRAVYPAVRLPGPANSPRKKP